MCCTGESYGRETTIDVIPDNVLLEVFGFCRKDHHIYYVRVVWKWHFLVHVCRRWRQLIFESPYRLNLQILCTHKTPVRENLRIWPDFPIVIDCTYSGRSVGPEGEDNVIAALEHPNRVCYVRLKVTSSELEKMVTLMQEPFPLLTGLEIYSNDGRAPVIPARFLGGSAPRLQEITSFDIPLPALPTLLLSTSNLITLDLGRIPPTGYISPEAMAAGFASLTSLETLFIGFQSTTPRSNPIRSPPVTQIVLPALTSFTFIGACKYLEDFIARIESPQLDQIHIFYLDQLFDIPLAQLAKFLDRSIGLKLTQLRHARVCFWVTVSPSPRIVK